MIPASFTVPMVDAEGLPFGREEFRRMVAVLDEAFTGRWTLDWPAVITHETTLTYTIDLADWGEVQTFLDIVRWSCGLFEVERLAYFIAGIEGVSV